MDFGAGAVGAPAGGRAPLTDARPCRNGVEFDGMWADHGQIPSLQIEQRLSRASWSQTSVPSLHS